MIEIGFIAYIILMLILGPALLDIMSTFKHLIIYWMIPTLIGLLLIPIIGLDYGMTIFALGLGGLGVVILFNKVLLPEGEK